MKPINFRINLYIFVDALLVIMLYLSRLIYRGNNALVIAVFFINLGFLQVCNYIVAKKSDSYIEKNFPEIYCKYNSCYSVYPQFVAAKLLFSGECNEENIAAICKQVKKLFVFIGISVFLTTWLMVLLTSGLV